MPERPKYLRDLDKERRADIQLGRSDAAFGKHTMSRPWQAYNQMQIMQGQADPDLDRLKAVRRDWNRNLKYTPAGMAVSGVTTPMEAQDAFVRSTEDFRQANKPAYNRMYPLPGNFMDFAEKGGLWGSILSEIAGKTKKRVKDFVAGDGITSIVAGDTPEDKERYITETFGPHLEDVPYGGPPPYEYEGPRPHPEGEEPLLGDFYENEKTREEKMQEYADELKRQIDAGETTAYSDILDAAIESQWPTKDPVVFDEYVSDRLEKLRNLDQERNDLPVAGEPLTFDEGKADFIRSQNEYVSPPPVFPGSVRQDPWETDEYLEWLKPDEQAQPSLIDYSDDPRTESGIANLMPGGPLYDEIPWKQRLNMRIAEEMQRRGPHANEPRTSYYGANWYDEYKRKLENEMEIAKGIRSPIDR